MERNTEMAIFSLDIDIVIVSHFESKKSITTKERNQ